MQELMKVIRCRAGRDSGAEGLCTGSLVRAALLLLSYQLSVVSCQLSVLGRRPGQDVRRLSPRWQDWML